MTRFALFSSLLLAASLAVDWACFGMTGPDRMVPVALLMSQCGVLAFVLLIVPGRPLARAACLLAAAAAMSAVFGLPPDLLARLLAVNAAAAMAVGSIGYRRTRSVVGETGLRGGVAHFEVAHTADHNTGNSIREINSTTRPVQFSLAQLLTFVTLVSLFLGFVKLWPPQPRGSLDVPLLVTIAFAALTAMATTIVLAERPCCRAVWVFFFIAIGITGLFLWIRYPWLAWWGFALLGLHVTLVVAMLLVLRTAGVRMERRPLVGRTPVDGVLIFGNTSTT